MSRQFIGEHNFSNEMEKLSRYYTPTMTWKNFNMPCYFPKNSPTFLEEKSKKNSHNFENSHANTCQYNLVLYVVLLLDWNFSGKK